MLWNQRAGWRSVFGILAVVLIGFVATHSKIKTDTSIGVVLSAFYALGFILISMAESNESPSYFYSVIFSSSDQDIMTTAIVLGLSIYCFSSIRIIDYLVSRNLIELTASKRRSYIMVWMLSTLVTVWNVTNGRDYSGSGDANYTCCDGLLAD